MEFTKKGFVKMTKSNIIEMFDTCNEKYFNNAIAKPKSFHLSTPDRKILGMVRPLYNQNTDSYGSALHISNLYDWTAENLEQVMVHEMIHRYIGDYLERLRWWERIFPFLVKQHNKEFIDLMNRLNERYGLHVQIKFKEMQAYLKKRRADNPGAPLMFCILNF